MQVLTTTSPEFERIIDAAPRVRKEQHDDERRKRAPHNPLFEVLPDGAWRGEPCFIVAGGPSLRGFDFGRLCGRGRVVAINKAYLHVPFADVLFFMDWREFYRRMMRDEFGPGTRDRWSAHQGLKVHLNMKGKKLDSIYSVRNLGRVGFSRSIKTGLYHGNNSGVGALGLAAAMRADPIYLLGYDGKFDGGASHFHGGYRRKMGEGVFKSFVKDMEAFVSNMRRALKGNVPRIINLNPASAFRMFEFGDLEEALR